MNEAFELKVNGRMVKVSVAPATPLLYVLRNNLKLNGPKFGCGQNQCGACMILLNGKAVTSCTLPVENVKEGSITTLEGLVEQNGKLHKVQQAFIDAQSAQCGYCLNGMIMSAISLLNKNSDPSEEAVRRNFKLNICRCGVHSRVIGAIQRVLRS
jgi:nicotinate dehydrogenase subunit A